VPRTPGSLRARLAAARERHRERHRPSGFGFALADSIEMRCRRVSFGRTALEPKAGLGARPERLWLWARHRNPALNLLIRNLLRAVPHGEAPERNPFNSPAAPRDE